MKKLVLFLTILVATMQSAYSEIEILKLAENGDTISYFRKRINQFAAAEGAWVEARLCSDKSKKVYKTIINFGRQSQLKVNNFSLEKYGLINPVDPYPYMDTAFSNGNKLVKMQGANGLKIEISSYALHIYADVDSAFGKIYYFVLNPSKITFIIKDKIKWTPVLKDGIVCYNDTINLKSFKHYYSGYQDQLKTYVNQTDQLSDNALDYTTEPAIAFRNTNKNLKDSIISGEYKITELNTGCSEMQQISIILKPRITLNISSKDTITVCSKGYLETKVLTPAKNLKLWWSLYYPFLDKNGDTAHTEFPVGKPLKMFALNYQSSKIQVIGEDTITACPVSNKPIFVVNKTNGVGMGIQIGSDTNSYKETLPKYIAYGETTGYKTYVCPGKEIVLKAYNKDVNNKTTFVWSDPTITNGIPFKPSEKTYVVDSIYKNAKYSETVSYYVTATDKDGCSSYKSMYIYSKYYNLIEKKEGTDFKKSINLSSQLCEGKNTIATFWKSYDSSITYRTIKGKYNTIVDSSNTFNFNITPKLDETYFVFSSRLKEDSSCVFTDTLYTKVNTIPNSPIISQIGDSLISTALINDWFVGDIVKNKDSQKIYLSKTYDNKDVYAIAKENGCLSEKSNIITLKLTGVNDISNNTKVYPTVIKDFLKYEVSINNNIVIQITSLDGKLCVKEHVNDFAGTINCSELTSGLYIVNVLNNDNIVSTQSFVKE